jgi:hypothetical protein
MLETLMALIQLLSLVMIFFFATKEGNCIFGTIMSSPSIMLETLMALMQLLSLVMIYFFFNLGVYS